MGQDGLWGSGSRVGGGSRELGQHPTDRNAQVRPLAVPYRAPTLPLSIHVPARPTPMAWPLGPSQPATRAPAPPPPPPLPLPPPAAHPRPPRPPRALCSQAWRTPPPHRQLPLQTLLRTPHHHCWPTARRLQPLQQPLPQLPAGERAQKEADGCEIPNSYCQGLSHAYAQWHEAKAR